MTLAGNNKDAQVYLNAAFGIRASLDVQRNHLLPGAGYLSFAAQDGKLIHIKLNYGHKLKVLCLQGAPVHQISGDINNPNNLPR